MNKRMTALLPCGLLLAGGLSIADQHEGDAGASDHATPVELYVCNFNEGKGHADLDKVVSQWNRWADRNGLDEYSAWTLVPFYMSAEQEFDVIWLGGAPSAASMGRAQDTYLTKGTDMQAAFADVVSCPTHVNMATLTTKEPDSAEPPDRAVISFSDCSLAEGASFDDVMPAIYEWGEYRAEHGSTGGHWIMFPAYGGGDEDFDFKFVAGWRTLEQQGSDWDQYSREGWKKAQELFSGKMDCDSSRVYVATNRRHAESD